MFSSLTYTVTVVFAIYFQDYAVLQFAWAELTFITLSNITSGWNVHIHDN